MMQFNHVQEKVLVELREIWGQAKVDSEFESLIESAIVYVCFNFNGEFTGTLEKLLLKIDAVDDGNREKVHLHLLISRYLEAQVIINSF